MLVRVIIHHRLFIGPDLIFARPEYSEYSEGGMEGLQVYDVFIILFGEELRR